MKITLSGRAILLALFLGFAGMNFSLAQAVATTNAAAGPQLPASRLDNDEIVQLHKVREQVLDANPDLRAEEQKLITLHEASQNQVPPATAEQRSAVFAEWQAYQKKLRGAMLKIDPTLKPIFAKLDEAGKHRASAKPGPGTSAD